MPLIIVLISLATTLQTGCSSVHDKSELTGVVTSGATPLSGVSITLTSPALAQPRVAGTDSEGAFRFRGLAAGAYQIEFNAEGFRVVSYTVQLSEHPEYLAAALLPMTAKEKQIPEATAIATTEVSAVAQFGMLLRNSEHRGSSNWSTALQTAKTAQGADLDGYRRDLVAMVETAAGLHRHDTKQTVRND